MPLSYMEHFLLQTEDIEATKDWYVKVLGFRVGPSPDFKFPVYWLYLGDRDVLHITTGGKNVSENRKKYVGQQSEAATGTGVIDHIGFRTTGLLEMIEHLVEPGGAEANVVDHPGASRRLGLLADVFLAVVADVLAAGGDVQHVTVAEVEPVHRKFEVRRGSHTEAQNLDVPVLGCLDILGLEQEVFHIIEGHVGSP